MLDSENSNCFVVIYWKKKDNQFFSVKDCRGELEKNNFIYKCEVDGYRYIVVQRLQKKNGEVFELMKDGFGKKLNSSVLIYEIAWFLFLSIALQYVVLLIFHIKL